jgi:hypothetical protein
MRHVIRVFAAVLLSLGALAGTAAAATTASQLVELMKAGLSDDILIALIQSDGSTFQLTASDILDLHRQGLSDRVILAMQQTVVPRSAPQQPESTFEPPAEPSPSFGQVVAPVVPEATPVSGTQSVEPSVPYYPTYPTYVPMFTVIGVPVATPLVHRPEVKTPVAPVYWGWGGQRRPDSWDDGNRRDAPKSTVPDKPKSTVPDKRKGG